MWTQLSTLRRRRCLSSPLRRGGVVSALHCAAVAWSRLSSPLRGGGVVSSQLSTARRRRSLRCAAVAAASQLSAARRRRGLRSPLRGGDVVSAVRRRRPGLSSPLRGGSVFSAGRRRGLCSGLRCTEVASALLTDSTLDFEVCYFVHAVVQF